MNLSVPSFSAGAIIALIVLLLVIVLFVVGRMAGLQAAILSLLALSRLL